MSARNRVALCASIASMFVGSIGDLPGQVANPLDQTASAARTDRHGDPLPPGAVARLGTSRLRTSSFVTAFSPDGRILALGAEEPKLRLWDVATGALVHELAGQHGIFKACFSQDGKRLVTGEGSGIIRVWDLATGEQIQTLGEFGKSIRSLFFSPDGQMLATVGLAGGDQTISLWDVASGRLTRQMRGDENRVSALAFSPDGKTLASGGFDRKVRLWETATGKERGLLEGHRFEVEFLAFAPDGRTLLSAARHGELFRWDLATNRLVGQWQKEWNEFTIIGLSPDGRRLAQTSPDKPLIHIWDTANLTLLKSIEAEESSHNQGVFSPDGKLLATHLIRSGIRLWDLETGKPARADEGHTSSVVAAVYSADSKLVVSAGHDGTVRQWDPKAGRELRKFRPETKHGVAVLALSPDGKRVVACGFDQSLDVWDVGTGKRLCQLPSLKQSPRCMAFSSDGKLVIIAGHDQNIGVWDADTGREVANFPAREFVMAMAVSHDGRRLATAGLRGTAQVYELATGKELRSFEGAGVSLMHVAIAPDGKTLATSSLVDRAIRLWDVESGREVGQFLTSLDIRFGPVTFSPDGKLLAAGHGQGMRVWEIASAQEIANRAGHLDRLTALAFSPDGKSLVSASGDATLLVWDIRGLVDDAAAIVEVGEKQLKELWVTLAGDDAAKAFRAGWVLAANPRQTVPFLAEHLRTQAVDERTVARLIRELGDDRFQTRERATSELAKLGLKACRALERELASDPSPEARRRLTELLGKQEGRARNPENLRVLRAIEVLERIGTPEAKKILEILADDKPETWLTDEARAALSRLARKAPTR